MRFIVHYAQQHNMEGVNPFFTSKFVIYPGKADFDVQLSKLIQALENKERTITFYAYKRVIERTRDNTGDVQRLLEGVK